MTKYTVIAAGFLALWSANAFALPCAASGLPSAIFQTQAASPSSLSGALNGNAFGSWPMCNSAGTGLITYPPGAAGSLIPFEVTTATTVQIDVAENDVSVLGTFFDLTVATGNPLSVVASLTQPTIPSDQLGSAGLTLNLAADVLYTLAITENTSASSFGSRGGKDSLDVTIAPVGSISTPEPATLGLLGFGVTCLVGLRRRRRPV